MFFIDPSSHDIGRSFSSAPASFTPSVRWGLGIDADDFRLSPTASSDRFSFHLLRPQSSLIDGYWELRSAIFCEEQHLFEESDRDELDSHRSSWIEGVRDERKIDQSSLLGTGESHRHRCQAPSARKV